MLENTGKPKHSSSADGFNYTFWLRGLTGSVLAALCLPLLHKATLNPGSCAAAPLQGYGGAIGKRGGCGYFTDIHRQLQLLCMTSQKVQIIKCTLGGFEGYPCAPTTTNAPCCWCKKYNTNICFLVGSFCRYAANTLDIHFRLVTDLWTDHIKPSSCGYNVQLNGLKLIIETQHLLVLMLKVESLPW